MVVLNEIGWSSSVSEYWFRLPEELLPQSDATPLEAQGPILLVLRTLLAKQGTPSRTFWKISLGAHGAPILASWMFSGILLRAASRPWWQTFT
jgi:hypothetical protein